MDSLWKTDMVRTFEFVLHFARCDTVTVSPDKIIITAIFLYRSAFNHLCLYDAYECTSSERGKRNWNNRLEPRVNSPRPLLFNLSEFEDQSEVEIDERHQRADRSKDEVPDRLVDDEVDLVISERRLLCLDRRLVGQWVKDVDDLPFEEARKVVDDGKKDDDEDGDLGLEHPAVDVGLLLPGVADGDVSVGCDQQDYPDGHRLGSRCQVPDVRLQVGEDSTQGRLHPSRVLVDCLPIH